MAEILHQLRLVVYPTIYRVLYMQGGAGFQPSTVSSVFFSDNQIIIATDLHQTDSCSTPAHYICLFGMQQLIVHRSFMCS